MSEEPKNPDAVAPETVQAYLRTRAAQFEEKKELATEHGETKVAFLEDTGFNKTAMAWAERLNRFSPEVRQDVLRSLDLIRAAMDGVWGQEETGDLFPPDGDTRDPAERLRTVRTSGRGTVDVTARNGEFVTVPPKADAVRVTITAAEAADAIVAGVRDRLDDNDALLDGPKGSPAFEAAKARVAGKNRSRREAAIDHEDLAEANAQIKAGFDAQPDDAA